MKKLTSILSILIILTSCNDNDVILKPMDFDDFKFAIANKSTSPNYVVIKIIQSNGIEKIICTEAPFLQGAIHKEKNIKYDESGISQVDSLLIKSFPKRYRN
jgi:hypothetical protein